MNFDESIALLGEKLDAWLDSHQAAFASQDRAAWAKALLGGFAITNELDKIKAEGLAAIALLLDAQHGTPAEKRTASLVRAFSFAAQLKAALHDELGDTDAYNELVLKMNTIATTLDESPPGRAALAVLLDHAKDSVRASAGAYLVDLMSGRVVPILREIDQKGGGASAYFTAHWALLDWELKQKADQTPP